MNIIYTLPTWLIVAGLVAMTLLATALGYRAGHSAKDVETERAYGVSTGVKASIFGLVALILGFTYSMTSSGFDDRQRLVLDEANSIGTCYLRAGLLSDGSAGAVRGALRRYMDLRIQLFDQGLDPEAYRRNSAAMDVQLDALWKSVEASARGEPDLTRNSLIVPAANAVIDLSSTRAWSVRNHVPPTVILLLGICMVASGILSGHSFGQVHRPSTYLWVVQNLLFALVLYVVLDFDRPRRGLIRVDEQPLIEQRNSMNS
jgi:hypothetical protein